MASVCVIINPASGRGRGGKILPQVRSAFDGIGVTDFRVTSGRATELGLALNAIDKGCSTIVAVGGDGTWSNIANAILQSGEDVILAPIAAGTGNDFAKGLGVDVRDVAEIARLVRAESFRRVDAGKAGSKFFINSLGFGFDPAVLAQTERIPILRGSSVYIAAALSQLFKYRGSGVRIRSGMNEVRQLKPLLIEFANGRHLGGAFLIAPDARIDDGLLDVVAISDASPLGRLRLFIAATRGKHVSLPNVHIEKSTVVTLEFDEPPQCQRDGELDQLNERTLEVSCVPRGLKVVAE